MTKLKRTDIFRDHNGLCQFEKGSLKTKLLISSRNIKNNILLANIFHSTLVWHLKGIHFFYYYLKQWKVPLKSWYPDFPRIRIVICTLFLQQRGASSLAAES